MDLESLRRKLASIGQSHVLRFYPELDSSQRQTLLEQIRSLDLDLVALLAERNVRQAPPHALPKDIRPAPAFPARPGAHQEKLYGDALRRGIELIQAGEVAAFLVAGGQGTRLGYDGPKGEFPITPIKNKPLFQVFAEQLRAWSRDSGKPIPWYVMTSNANDAATRAFFERHGNFGYDREILRFLQQGMMPAFGDDGRILLADKDLLALSPDGHGGSLRALAVSGALDDMKRRGIRHLSYFQVDNPLVHCIDPLFLGLHDLSASEMSSKMIPKAGPTEKVGNFVVGDGALQVIEYSDLPESLARETNPDGSLRFNAGSIAIHAMSVDFIERLNAGGQLHLPWHRAEKKVPCVDDKGRAVRPQHNNAIKLEQFVFDAIPLAKNAIVCQTDRSEEFSPVKNAEGVDSPESARRDQLRRATRWLRDSGVEISCKASDFDPLLEISPLFAVSAQQLRTRKLPAKAEPGDSIYLGP
ncbi:MAG: UTP--glucose-1-phosphate uridylyltransferase [Tepidisphaeraceae bacterium]